MVLRAESTASGMTIRSAARRVDRHEWTALRGDDSARPMRPSSLIKSISVFDRLPLGCRHDDITQSFAWSRSSVCLPRGPRKACAALAKRGGERCARVSRR
ncbi:hypothetical protein AQ611_13245 [Burkholderia singularis]|nr:hypothetical protein AQ611_13245 [Burkholderia sp. Bp7605]